MRNLNQLDAPRLRGRGVIEIFGSEGDHTSGVFELRSTIDGAALRVVASVGDGWDHVSVSRANRCPNWPEMEQVKRAFFRDDETAMQLHVPPSDHVNCHPFTLHLWRPLEGEIPRPPSLMVGVAGPVLRSRAEALALRRRVLGGDGA